MYQNVCYMPTRVLFVVGGRVWFEGFVPPMQIVGGGEVVAFGGETSPPDPFHTVHLYTG